MHVIVLHGSEYGVIWIYWMQTVLLYFGHRTKQLLYDIVGKLMFILFLFTVSKPSLLGTMKTTKQTN